MKDWKKQNNGLQAKYKVTANNLIGYGSFRNNRMVGILLVLTSTVLVSFAQVAFKMSWSGFSSFSQIDTILLGLGLYSLGALIFMAVLRKNKVTYLFPFMTLSYVWVIILSAYLFKEPVTLVKILGISLIFTGIFLIYVGSRDTVLNERKVML